MAESDETPTIADAEEAKWAAAQRHIVESYLESQGCAHAGVSIEPRWCLPPFLAVWAVRSRANPELVGWWAVSGDVPTDYATATPEIRSTADVLAHFSARWLRAAETISRGHYAGIGSPEDAAELAPLLRARAETLKELSETIHDVEREQKPSA